MMQKLEHLLRRIRDDKRMQISACCFGLALVFLLAAWIPWIVYKKQPQQAEGPSLLVGMRERSALFLRYTAGDSGCSSQTTSGKKMSGERIEAARDVLETVSAQFVTDREAGTAAAEGEELLTISNGDVSIHVYHYYREWTGDWSNWLEVYIDADYGDIYYFYVSSKWIGGADYSGVKESVQLIAERLTEVSGYEMVTVSEEDGNAGEALYVTENSVVKYKISYIHHVNNLLDVKFAVEE